MAPQGGTFPRAAGICLVLVTVLFSGCASQLEYRQVVEKDHHLPRQVELTDTPFHPQTTHHCGPASLAMLLNAADVPVSPEDIADSTYVPGRQGSLGLELLATPRQYQRLGYPVGQRLDSLLVEVAAGRPVMVLQNLGLSWLPQWHYAVLIGFDLDEGEVILRSGTSRRITMPLKTFERTWLRGERWAMLVLRPGELPATPRETDYLQAVVGLEKQGQLQAAAEAYEKALRLWPASVNTWMAWGNNRYALGDPAAAEDAYRRALALDPDFAPAYNNLAQVLMDTARWEDAETAALAALARADDHRPVYEQTLREIRQAKPERARNELSEGQP